MAARSRGTGATFIPVESRGRTNPNRLPTVPNELLPTTTPVTDPFGLFDDPSTQLFTNMIRDQLGTLSQPIVDPTRDAVMALISSRLPGMLSGGGFSSGGSGGNAYLADFITSGRKRMEELNQEPFSAAEEQAMKTRTMEEVEQLRTSGKQRATEDAARRGLGESSGVLQAQYRDVDRSMDANRAKGANDLMLAIAQERQRRRDQAVTIGGQIASAGHADAGLRLSDAQLRQGDARLNAEREMQAMGLAQVLANLSASTRGEQDARRKESVGLAGILADLPVQRLMTMLNVLNGSGGNNLSSLASQIAQSQQTAQQNRQYSDQGQAAWLAALGQMLGYFGTQGRAT